VATPALPPAWRDEAGGYPIELVHEGRRRRWPWLVIIVIFLLLASALCVGLPGSGHVRVTVKMAGGPFDLSGNSVGATGGRIEIHQLGRTVRRMTVPPGLSETVRLRPGLLSSERHEHPRLRRQHHRRLGKRQPRRHHLQCQVAGSPTGSSSPACHAAPTICDLLLKPVRG
jgi:hypothetical protein